MYCTVICVFVVVSVCVCGCLLQVVIPNKMGMVLYHPSSATSGLIQHGALGRPQGIRVSQKSEQLCRLLVQRYRVNLLDHAVHQVRSQRCTCPWR